MLVEQAVKAQEIFNGITLEKQEFNKVLNKAKRNIPKFKIERNRRLALTKKVLSATIQAICKGYDKNK